MEEPHLVAGADKVVLRVLDLIVGVAVYVVGEEADLSIGVRNGFVPLR